MKIVIYINAVPGRRRVRGARRHARRARVARHDTCHTTLQLQLQLVDTLSLTVPCSVDKHEMMKQPQRTGPLCTHSPVPTPQCLLTGQSAVR